jgi:hypothetical protein
MLKSGRNNLALLSVMGLLAIPSIAAGVAILQRWRGGWTCFASLIGLFCCAVHVMGLLAIPSIAAGVAILQRWGGGCWARLY